MNRTRSSLILLAVLLASVLVMAGDKNKKNAKDSDASANLSFTVARETSGKPVKYAAIVLHAVEKSGKQGNGGLNLKTNEEGKASIAGIPYGTVRIQVIAKGFQTYGEDIQVSQPEMDITIKLKPPAEQYTIYK